MHSPFDPKMLVQARRKRERLIAAETIAQQVESVARNTSKIIEDMEGALANPLQGPPGENGLDGIDGAPGRDGIDGLHGKDGAPGRDGLNGKDGLPGKDGKDGLPGKDGNPGRDGVDGAPGKDGKNGSDAQAVRVEIYTGKIDSTGQATITFSPAFKTVPTILPTPLLVGGQLVFPLVVGTPTINGCKVTAKVTVATVILNASPVTAAALDTPITVVAIG